MKKKTYPSLSEILLIVAGDPAKTDRFVKATYKAIFKASFVSLIVGILLGLGLGWVLFS